MVNPVADRPAPRGAPQVLAEKPPSTASKAAPIEKVVKDAPSVPPASPNGKGGTYTIKTAGNAEKILTPLGRTVTNVTFKCPGLTSERGVAGVAGGNTASVYVSQSEGSGFEVEPGAAVTIWDTDPGSWYATIGSTKTVGQILDYVFGG